MRITHKSARGQGGCNANPRDRARGLTQRQSYRFVSNPPGVPCCGRRPQIFPKSLTARASLGEPRAPWPLMGHSEELQVKSLSI